MGPSAIDRIISVAFALFPRNTGDLDLSHYADDEHRGLQVIFLSGRHLFELPCGCNTSNSRKRLLHLHSSLVQD